MKISVGSRSGRSGNQPHRLCLGRCSLPVTAVLDRQDDGEARVFDVRVLDGRRFIVRRQTQHGEWELVAAYGPLARRRRPACPATVLTLPRLVSLYLSALLTIKRIGAARHDAAASKNMEAIRSG
jgi:hypothetical protein